MRFLFVAPVAISRFHQTVPVAWAARAAGHEVRVAGRPELHDAITASGLPAVAAGDPDVLPGSEPVLDRTGADPVRVLADYVSTQLAHPAVESMHADLVRFARRWRPDLVLWSPRGCPASVAASATGTAHVRLLDGPDDVTALRAAAGAGDPVRDHIAAQLARFGTEFTEEAVTGLATVDPLPAAFAPAAAPNRIAVRYLPHGGTGVVPASARRLARGTRVCVVLSGDPAPFAPLFDALGRLDLDVLAVLDVLRLPLDVDVPANVRLLDPFPVHTVLPDCAAVIHDGEVGTICAALAHGLPQLALLDGAGDGVAGREAGLARRLGELGAGLVVDGVAGVAPEVLATRVATLLDDPGIRARAALVRAEISAAPAPGDIVPVLEGLTSVPSR